MGILDVFSTSTQGLSAQSFALQNISGNIANSTTVGFKRTDTGFADLIPDAASVPDYMAGSVGAYSQLTNTVQGDLSATGVATNMALSGTGYFVVGQNGSGTGAPGANGQALYTRRGDFTTDQNGYLVNGAGYYLMGSSTDPASGKSAGSAGTSASSPIRISNATLASGASLSGITVEQDGTLTGSYSDGQTARLGQVAVAHLPGNAFLKQEDGGAFSSTEAAGKPIYGLNGSSISGGEVEGSNTDIADQFSKMIMTQQAYSSNTKVLTTANEMLQDAINILR